MKKLILLSLFFFTIATCIAQSGYIFRSETVYFIAQEEELPLKMTVDCDFEKNIVEIVTSETYDILKIKSHIMFEDGNLKTVFVKLSSDHIIQMTVNIKNNKSVLEMEGVIAEGHAMINF